MRILLIDDSAAYIEEFAPILARSGVTYSALDQALDPTEGRRLLTASAHDLYVIDYRLPGESGLDLIRWARASGIVKPIIVLTAYDHPQVDAAAETAGANDYLRKGDFTPELLGRAIRYAVRNAASVETAKAAELRFAMAQEAADIGTWDWDIAANTFLWSRSQYINFGLDPDNKGPVTYESWYAAIHPEDRVAVEAAMMAALAKRTPFSATFRVVFGGSAANISRSLHWISVKGRVLRDGAGNPTRMVGVSIDITEQQHALNALRDSRNLAMAGLQISESRLKTYFDNSSDCLFYLRLTPERRFVYEAVNPAGLATIGMSGELVRGRGPREVLGAENGAQMEAGLQHVLETGTPYLYEPTFQYGGGSVVYDALYMPLFDERGEVIGVLGNARDITERRNLEASLRQAQKMEALGQLASGVAHDFNNILTGMLSCLRLLEKHVTSEKGRMLVTEGSRTVERGKSLTDRLLAFSRQQPMTTQPVDCNGSIEEMSDLFSRTLLGVRLSKNLAPDLWPALADRTQFELALLNLAVNARDAMPLGGSFVIETSNETVTQPQHDGLPPGDYVAIRLTDSGTGMSPETKARAMDPFFTTKVDGKGTGLGLSMVFGMVKQLGGALRIESEPTKGTTVTILLPRCRSDAGSVAAPREVPAPRHAAILVVDDNPDAVAAVRAYAGELGLGVVAASGSAEALALFAGGFDCDLLIADATLPGLSGAALIKQIRARFPQMPALLVSGHAAGRQDTLTGGAPFLAKPFTKEAFERAILPLLRGGSSDGNIVHLATGGSREQG